MNVAIQLMNKLSYPKKMLLISIVFLVPIVLLITLLLSQLGSGIATAEKETRGLEFVKTVRQMYQHLPQHRGMTNAYLNGSSSFKSKILSKRKEIVADIAAIDAVNSRLGEEFSTQSLWAEIKQDWKQLEPNAFYNPAKQTFQEHTALIAKIYTLFEHISNKSGLVLDPELNTFYIMDAIVYRLPNVTENLGQSRGMGSGIAAGGTISLDQRIALGTLLARIESNAKAVNDGMAIALEENPQLKVELSALLESSKSATDNFIDKVTSELLTAEFISSNSSDIFAAGTAAIKANYQVYDTLVPVLDRLFQDRVDRFASQRLTTLVTVLITLLIAIYLFVGFYKSMITAVQKLRAATQRVSDGDLTINVDCGTEDELKEVEVALNAMVKHLNTTVKSLGSNASLLASASEELSATTSQARAGAQEQQQQTDQIATAMNEMTSTVQEIARNAELVAAESHTADREAKEGSTIISATIKSITDLSGEVGEAAEVIHQLEKNSNDIGTVLDVIKSIAEQTNLLALNAAIEAARAGEHGRGFAVVADEVRTLASRTQESTEQIQNMVSSLQTHTHKAVEVMDSDTKHAMKMAESTGSATESIDRIVESVTKISDMSTQVASASEEQSLVSEEINRNIVRIADLSVESMSGSEQIALGSDELAKLASELEMVVAHFKV
ncbi:MAG: HAMP domain-containing protein [Methylophaga sp.]|nr:HAMP domain-containing protein [Methylophaga sp.]